MKKLFLAAGFFTIFFCSVIWLVPDSADTRCTLERDLINSEYTGIVMEKFVDSSNHSYPILRILASKDSIITLNLVLEKNGLFNKILLNDSIFKPKGNDTVFSVISGKQKAIGKANFACDTSR